MMMPNTDLQNDLAGRQHWDQVYSDANVSTVEAGWHPVRYDELTLENMLLTEISRCQPKRILEIGCGNSNWLPYLAHKTGALVAGLDYSEQGCNLVRQRLAVEGIKGEIFCADLFQATPTLIGQYDFVFSLGLVEHFTDLDHVLKKLLEFVSLGGVLFTEVPNMASIHGILSWIWQPEQLAKHRLLTRKGLTEAYRRQGLSEIHGEYSGLFSLNIPAWPYNPRWPRLAPKLLPLIYRVERFVERRLRSMKHYRGIAPFAPFIYLAGRKMASKE